MQRRDVGKGLLVAAAAVAVQPRVASAQTCTPPCFPQTAAESAASVTPSNYAYPPLDIRRYGGDPTGATASDAALVAALAVCGTDGGRIILGGGSGAVYKLASQYNLTNRRSIIFQGDAAPSSGAVIGTTLSYTGTATPWFNISGANGIGWQNLWVRHENAGFTGTYITGGNQASYNFIESCTVGNGVSNATHLNLDKSNENYFNKVVFISGDPSVLGQAAAGGSTSVANSFFQCAWLGSGTTPVQYGGDSWSFSDCVFEPLGTGSVAGAFGCGASTPNRALSFRGCFFDGPVTSGVWLTIFGEAICIDGCLLAGGTNTESISLNNVNGARITNNEFNGYKFAVAFGTSSPCTGIVVQSNDFNNQAAGGAIFGNISNAPLNLVFNPNRGDASAGGTPIPPPAGLGENSTQGFEISSNGIIRQWGSATVTTGSPFPVTFPKAYPNAVFNVTATLNTPSGSNNTLWTSSLGKSGVTLNVGGLSGVSNVYWQAIGN